MCMYFTATSPVAEIPAARRGSTSMGCADTEVIHTHVL